MKDLFIPYEQALQLKKLGFDEECLGFYERDQKFIIQECEITDFHSNSLQCVAPTFSQAFRWFREKYELHIYVKYAFMDFDYTYYIWDSCNNQSHDSNDFYKTYEEAEQACLEKLIEIVKNK